MPIAKESESKFTPVPEGTHPARCFAAIALGTQKSLNPQYKPSLQALVNFEIPGETVVINGEEKPMIISHFVGLYLGSNEKPSNARKFLESWRGKKFSDVEAKRFDLANLVGAKCMVNVIHEEKNGKTREKIASISPLPKGFQLPNQFHSSVVYEIEQGRDAVFNDLPEWVRKKIEACIEWTTPGASADSESDAADKYADEAATEKKEGEEPPF